MRKPASAGIGLVSAKAALPSMTRCLAIKRWRWQKLVLHWRLVAIAALGQLTSPLPAAADEPGALREILLLDVGSQLGE